MMNKLAMTAVFLAVTILALAAEDGGSLAKPSHRTLRLVHMVRLRLHS